MNEVISMVESEKEKGAEEVQITFGSILFTTRIKEVVLPLDRQKVRVKMQIVIDIDESIAQGIIDGENDAPRNIVRGFQATIADAIKKGTPLPKGHGRLIDADAMQKYQIDTFGQRLLVIDTAPTIIEAESEDKE